MKKRSLVAALAMLIVSAVVLTSATYAWFAAGATATVAQISGTVTNSDGSVMVSGDGTNWKFNIAANDITTKNISTALVPVSITPAATNPSIMGGGFGNDGETWSYAAATAGSQYTYYKFYLKTTDGSTVTCTPQNYAFDANFLRALVIINGTQYKVYGAAGATAYTPIAYKATLPSTTGTDANHNSIMDSGEGIDLATNSVSCDTITAFTISTTAEVAQEIEVYLWAEGQEASCKGTVPASSVAMGFQFTK